MAEFQASWGDDSGSSGNPFAKGDPAPGVDAEEKFMLSQEETASAIQLLKKLGKSEDEIESIIGAPLHPDGEPSAKPMFPGDRMGR